MVKQSAHLRPRPMRCAILTAAVQEIVPRAKFMEDPDDAALEAAVKWAGVGAELGVDLELSAAFPYQDDPIPPEALLDPVAPHVPIRTPKTGTGHDLRDEDLRAIVQACGGKARICDLGFFNNLLHPDEATCKRIHEHLLRCARAAAALKGVGCTGVAGFIGWHMGLDQDQNVALFEKWVVPLLKEFQKLGVIFYLEQCPMPGWNTTDNVINNIGYCAGMWIKLYRIAEKHGVADVFRGTYDESHDILYGNTHHGSFAAMAAAGLQGFIGRFHGKNNYRNAAKVALWTVLGQHIDLGCRKDGVPDPDPAKQCQAWGVLTADHGMVGIGHYNPLAMFQGREADWHDHQLAARKVLGLDPEQTYFVLEHEWARGVVKGLEIVQQVIAVSSQYFRGIDAAADAQYRAELLCAELGLPFPGTPNPAYNFPGLAELAMAIKA